MWTIRLWNDIDNVRSTWKDFKEQENERAYRGWLISSKIVMYLCAREKNLSFDNNFTFGELWFSIIYDYLYHPIIFILHYCNWTPHTMNKIIAHVTLFLIQINKCRYLHFLTFSSFFVISSYFGQQVLFMKTRLLAKYIAK